MTNIITLILLFNSHSTCSRMCHTTIHRFFTNQELAENFHSIDLLLTNDKFLRYAKFASQQKDTRTMKVR